MHDSRARAVVVIVKVVMVWYLGTGKRGKRVSSTQLSIEVESLLIVLFII